MYSYIHYIIFNNFYLPYNFLIPTIETVSKLNLISYIFWSWSCSEPNSAQK